MAGRWAECAQLYHELNDGELTGIGQFALASFAAGDVDAYRENCRLLLAKSLKDAEEKKLDPIMAYLVAVTCVLGDDAVDDMEPVLRLVRRGLEIDKRNPGMLVALGAAQCRAGQLKEAKATLSGALTLHGFAAMAAPGHATEIRTSQLTCLIFLAKVHHDLDEQDAMQKDFAAIDKLIPELEKMKPPTDGRVVPWLIKLSILLTRREQDRLKAPPREPPAAEVR